MNKLRRSFMGESFRKSWMSVEYSQIELFVIVVIMAGVGDAS